MAPHLTADPDTMHQTLPPASVLEGSDSRSPAVSLAVALGVVGFLLAGSGVNPLPRPALMMLFFVIAIEVEVRDLRVPFALALGALGSALLYVGATESAQALADAASGAALVLVLAAPLLATGVVRVATLIAAAVPGALWGVAATPSVLLIAMLIGAPLLTLRTLRRGSTMRTFPFIAVLGLAAALHQLF